MTGHQMRSAAAGPVAFGAGAQGRGHACVVRESQIVIAAKRQQGFAAHTHLRALRRFKLAPGAIQVLRAQTLQLVSNIVKHYLHCAGVYAGITFI